MSTVKNNKLALLIAGALTLSGSQAFALPASSVPNTFTSGSTIVADEMNANFTAVVDSINTLAAVPAPASLPDGVTAGDLVYWDGAVWKLTPAPPVAGATPHTMKLVNDVPTWVTTDAPATAPVLKGNDGAVAGRVIGISDLYYVAIVSDTGYMTQIDRLTGETTHNRRIFFTGASCNGLMYATFARMAGTVFRPSGQQWDVASAVAGDLYVYAPQEAVQSVTTLSRLNYSGLCEVIPAQEQSIQGYSVLVNDPVVTGIQNAPFTFPMSIE